MTSDGSAGDPSAFSPINVNGLAQSAVQAFGIFESAQTAQTAAKKLTSSSLTYVILGLGGLALVGLLIFKH